MHTKFGPGRFSRFDVYWIQTDKLNLYIDIDNSVFDELTSQPDTPFIS